MKGLSPKTLCKVHKAWYYVQNLSLGVFMIVCGAFTGWFVRDVVSTAERRTMWADFNAQYAALSSSKAEEIARLSAVNTALLQEKDTRIQDLTEEVLELTGKTSALAGTTVDIQRKASSAAEEARKASDRVTKALDSATAKKAIEQANEIIKRNEEKR